MKQCPEVNHGTEYQIEIALHEKFDGISGQVDEIVIFVGELTHQSGDMRMIHQLCQHVERDLEEHESNKCNLDQEIGPTVIDHVLITYSEESKSFVDGFCYLERKVLLVDVFSLEDVHLGEDNTKSGGK